MPIASRQTKCRKEIWLVSLNDTEGHEQVGTRPAIVFAVHRRANVCMVVPMTGNQDVTRFPYTHAVNCTTINGLTCNSVAQIYQMRCLTSSRFIRRLGIIEQNDFDAIKTLIINYLGF